MVQGDIMTLTRRYTLAALLPALLLMLALVAFPTIFIFTLSFRDYVLTDVTSPRDFVGFANFARLFSDTRFGSAAWRTGLFVLISVGTSLLAGLALGKLLTTKARGVGFLRTVMIVPMVITPLVVGAAFRFMLDYDLGVVNWFLSTIGLPKVGWLSQASLALPTAALVDAWQWTPFVALVVAAGLESIPTDPLEAAQVDGANWFQELRYVTLPLLRPLMVVIVLIRTMDAFREFDKIYIMTAGGPGTSSETLPIFVWRAAFNYYNMGYAAAAGVVMLIGITVVSAVMVGRTRALEVDR
jgi:multiple sugar transport system permease protein